MHSSNYLTKLSHILKERSKLGPKAKSLPDRKKMISLTFAQIYRFKLKLWKKRDYKKTREYAVP